MEDGLNLRIRGGRGMRITTTVKDSFYFCTVLIMLAKGKIVYCWQQSAVACTNIHCLYHGAVTKVAKFVLHLLAGNKRPVRGCFHVEGLVMNKKALWAAVGIRFRCIIDKPKALMRHPRVDSSRIEK